MLNAKLKGWLFAALASSISSVAWSQVVQLDSVVAIVDEDIILASEVRERVEQVKATAAQRNMTLPDDETVVQETLDRLILESIQLQLADRYGVRVPDAQLIGVRRQCERARQMHELEAHQGKLGERGTRHVLGRTGGPRQLWRLGVDRVDEILVVDARQHRRQHPPAIDTAPPRGRRRHQRSGGVVELDALGAGGRRERRRGRGRDEIAELVQRHGARVARDHVERPVGDRLALDCCICADG